MEKQWHIDILVTDAHVPSRGGPDHLGSSNWQIVVSSNDPNAPEEYKGEKWLFSSLLHELGHVIGRGFYGELQSLEDLAAVNMFGTVTPSVYKEEVRAWDIGQKLFDESRKVSLELYRNQEG